MNKNLLLLPLVIGLCVINSVQAQELSWRYKLIFSDEFEQADYTSPDTNKWNYHTRYPGMWSRWIDTSPETVYIKDSILVCRAIPNLHHQSDTAQMLTGAINTLGKFSFKYGRIDVRMRTNIKRGNFPAVWMRPTLSPNSPYGEIDVVEMFGDQKKTFHSIHSHRTYTLKKSDIPSSFTVDLDIEEWHIYSVEWTKRSITWLVDGVEVAVYKKRGGRKMKKEGQWSFDRPFYLIINQSVGDNSRPFFRVDTNQVYETQFDWIRVYQKK